VTFPGRNNWGESQRIEALRSGIKKKKRKEQEREFKTICSKRYQLLRKLSKDQTSDWGEKNGRKTESRGGWREVFPIGVLAKLWRWQTKGAEARG